MFIWYLYDILGFHSSQYIYKHCYEISYFDIQNIKETRTKAGEEHILIYPKYEK